MKYETVETPPPPQIAELTPEFYASDGSFLQQPDLLDLGVRANGRRVGDVVLPPWAYGAADFVARCREALESDIVSAQLHHWIDLIFGFKSRGPAAEASDNLFYYLTYDSAVDIEAVADPERRAALQAQVAEFGQTPRQLFTHRHPSRGSGVPVPRNPSSMTEDPEDEENAEAALAAGMPGDAAAGAGMADVDSSETGLALSVDSWKALVWHRAEFAGGGSGADTDDLPSAAGQQLAQHSETVTRVAAVAFRSANAGAAALHVLSASRDGSVALCDVVVPPKSVAPAPAHPVEEPSLVLTRCRVVPEVPRAPSASPLSSLLLMWSALHGTAGAGPAKPMPVSAAACDATHAVVFSACWGGNVFAHDATSGSLLWHQPLHAAAISDIAVIALPACLPAEEWRESGALQRSAAADVPRGGPSEEGAVERYALVTSAWDGSVAVSAVAVARHPASGEVSVRSCAADVLAPGIHSAAITAVAWSPVVVVGARGGSRAGAAGGADFDVLTADAAGSVVWLRIKARAAAGPRAATAAPVGSPAVALTIDLIARTSDLVNPATARRGADPMSGGISGVTCLAVSAAAGGGRVPRAAAFTPGGLLVAATTVDGRLCVLAGTPASSAAQASLALIGTVATGEVLRCVSVDSAGLVLVTGGHHCRLRLWDVARIVAASAAPGASQRELCSSDAELSAACGATLVDADAAAAAAAALPESAVEREDAGVSSSPRRGTGPSNALDVIVPGAVIPPALASKPWITACALVEVEREQEEEDAQGVNAALPFLGSSEQSPSVPLMLSRPGRGAVCLVAGTHSGHLIVWTSTPAASARTAAASLALRNATL